MTRDVRVALLVGLIFIVLFGLVLGDHSVKLSRTSKPALPTATTWRMAAGPEVRSVAFQRTEMADEPPVLSPEPAPQRRGPADVAVPPRSSSASADRPEPPPGHGAAVARRGPDSGRAGPSHVRTPGSARQMSPPPGREASGEPAPTPVPQPFGRYRVKRGDSLIRIARKVWGQRHADKYMLIYQANRSRLRDPQTLAVGQELMIPPLPGAGSSARARRAMRRPPASAGTGRRHYREVTLGALERSLRRYRVYAVRPGDTLTGIARCEMGDGSRRAVRALYRANRDRIGNPDDLPVGLKLRIPRWRGGGG